MDYFSGEKISTKDDIVEKLHYSVREEIEEMLKNRNPVLY
jgi:hypothetical protein